MPKITEAQWTDLLNPRFIANARSGVDPQFPFAQARGFHIYGELSLKLRLCAAETEQHAQRYLSLLQDYTELAEQCGGVAGTTIFEVHGERSHLFLPCEAPDLASVSSVIGFATSFTQTVYQQIAPKAGNDWDGFYMAADFGPAILVSSSTGGGSLVSLGNCANAPAKRLDKVPAGHLSMRTETLRKIWSGWTSAEWTNLNVQNPNSWVKKLSNSKWAGQMMELANAIGTRQRTTPSVLVGNSKDFVDPKVTISAPLRVQGYCLRADLDGFSKEVQNATYAGQSAVVELVSRFHEIMGFPADFARELKRPVIEFPWAGDCATLMVLANPGEPFGDTRRFLPTSLPLMWHTHSRGTWANRFKNTRWAVGVAGGTHAEGSDAHALVANIAASTRQFRMVAGWGARRSHDAYQADGVRGDDSLIPKIDYSGLDTRYQDGFREHDTRFMRASLDGLIAANRRRLDGGTRTQAVEVPKVNVHIPRAQPWLR